MAPTLSSEPGASGARVVLEAGALEDLVSRLRPLAVTAFLHVAAGALPDERGVLEAMTSSRTLARRFGVDKDTAAGVLKTLVRRGYLRRLAQPRSGARFAPARYVVRLPDGVDVTPALLGDPSALCPPPSATVAPPVRRGRRAPASVSPRHDGAARRRANAAYQLGLFAPAASVTDETGAR